VESLEGRQLPSVSLIELHNPLTGAVTGLRVASDGANDTVTITDDSTTGHTRIVANGKMTDFAHQFAQFDLELMARNDTVTFNLLGPLNHQQAHLFVDLGRGENHFNFNPGLTAIENRSDVSLDIVGHNGNDFVNLKFGNILESRVDVTANNLGGTKGKPGSTVPRDSITFGTLRAGIRNSSVDVNIGLGTGINNLVFNYGSDLGHLAPPRGTPAAAEDFGPSTFNVDITGSNRPQDVANVMLFANGEVNTGSTLNFTTQFIAGNNSFKGVIDAAQFQIDDDGGAFIIGPSGSTPPHSGGAAHLNLRGGSGNDNISLVSINQKSTIELSGLFDINIAAGSGKDSINVDLGGAGFTDDDPFEKVATNRALRLRIDGGSGPDTINVKLANAATATFAFDVAIVGGSEKNDIIFDGNNAAGGKPTFGPSGSVFIDGGLGTASDVDVMGNFPVDVVNG
jgi:hypothetical protein